MKAAIHIGHIAIWTADIERSRKFYERFFGGASGEKYTNEVKQFQSYFVRFSSGAELEIMQRDDINRYSDLKPVLGLTHIAFRVGSAEAVDELTSRIENEGYDVLGRPRTTGDGYYESVIADPDGNTIEIIA